MSELYLVKACCLEKAWKMLNSVLGEAVSDEEDAEFGFTLAGTWLSGADKVCDVLKNRVYACLEYAEILDLLFFSIRIIYRRAVVVCSDLTAGNTVLPCMYGTVISPEESAVSVIREDLAIVRTILEYGCIGKGCTG